MSFVLIESDLATIGFSGRDEATLAITLDKHDHVQTRAQRDHGDQPRLAIVLATILKNERYAPTQVLKIAEIDAMLP
jgi:hypothetical protein